MALGPREALIGGRQRRDAVYERPVPRARNLRPPQDLLYDCDRSSLPGELGRRFVKLDLGDEGETYIEDALTTRPGKGKTTLHRLLRSWVSDFDADGLLDMYPMHLLGTAQWRALLGDRAGQRHLDVGAGAGHVTAKIAPLVGETVTTETSRVMARKLRHRGFKCFEADVAVTGAPEPHYDLVTCLNVLDRCPKPKSLLAAARAALAPGGRLVLAVPLPLNAFFYDGPVSRNQQERLDVSGADWEHSAALLVENTLDPLGFEVEAISRVPYLCRGDSQQELYVLDDVLLMCK
jgi:SAM-dependent methyltransferase